MKDIISGLNKLFDSRIRLGIMSILMVNDWVDFNSLKELIGITDGNLASHLSTLEKSELIEIRKQFIGKKPNTRYRITQKGRELFKSHLDNLSRLIDTQT
jgi:DNA-binding HxlR family transcriptional regulator